MLVLALGVSAQRQMNEEQRRLMEAKAAGGEQWEQAKAGLYAKLKGNNEFVYTEVAQSFYQLGMESTTDSIYKVILKKFPKGEYARNMALNKIYDENDPAKKEKLYKDWLKRFPMDKLGESVVYDYATYSVGYAYAEAGNIKKQWSTPISM